VFFLLPFLLTSTFPQRTHLFGLRHRAVLLQAADLPLQLQVGLLQLADLLDELADVIQVTQARTQRVGARLLCLHEQRVVQVNQE